MTLIHTLLYLTCTLYNLTDRFSEYSDIDRVVISAVILSQLCCLVIIIIIIIVLSQVYSVNIYVMMNCYCYVMLRLIAD